MHVLLLGEQSTQKMFSTILYSNKMNNHINTLELFTIVIFLSSRLNEVKEKKERRKADFYNMLLQTC